MALSTDDRLEIQELYARYNHALDFGDASGWAGCFTPDGVFASPNGTFSGTEQLQQFAQGFADRHRPPLDQQPGH
ncbi:MAG: nuclear transport factor 2 family protein [Dehalococcoidia bacterium]|nr:nuclear transport factor 2 family protein [Dehalococcoidia bacterium]